MALAGEGAICIWNGIADGMREEFYAWHVNEHMPERVGIPGFLRGRRYIACEPKTSPEFFTLYETLSPQVTTGHDYLTRLNNPTPWTRKVTPDFRKTARALTRVAASFGPGSGGIIATLRFALSPGPEEDMRLQALAADLLPKLATRPEITGVHLCQTDEAASEVKTAESRARTDIEAAPNSVILIEACNLVPVEAAVTNLLSAPAFAIAGQPVTGFYRLEYTRLKTATSAG